jgi:hypothetical protein
MLCLYVSHPPLDEDWAVRISNAWKGEGVLFSKFASLFDFSPLQSRGLTGTGREIAATLSQSNHQRLIQRLEASNESSCRSQSGAVVVKTSAENAVERVWCGVVWCEFAELIMGSCCNFRSRCANGEMAIVASSVARPVAPRKESKATTQDGGVVECERGKSSQWRRMEDGWMRGKRRSRWRCKRNG